MDKEKSKNQECPLCSVSDETLDKLRKEREDKKFQKNKKNKKRFLGKILALILVLALVGLVSYKVFIKSPPEAQEAIRENSENVQVNSLAPDFTLEDVNGNQTILSDFRGKKPVLLVFWATWCGYCTKELPDLIAFTQEYWDEIQVIAVSSGESRETLRNYIQEKNVNFLMLLDEDRKIWNQYLVRGTPSHFLVDKQGKIIALRPGLASRENLETLLTMLR